MNSDLIIPVLVACIMALPGVWSAYINLRGERRETDESVVDGWRLMVDPLKVELRELRAEVDALQTQVEAQRERIRTLEAELQRTDAGANLLINQIRARGLEPIWTPTEGN